MIAFLYFEDSSNHEDHYLRNRLRHHIIPLLKNECGDFYSKILEYSIQLKEAFDFIRSKSKEFLDKYDNKIKLNVSGSVDIISNKALANLLVEYDRDKIEELYNQYI